MRLAARLEALPPYPFVALGRAKAEVRATGADLIDLSIGDPDLPTPEHIVAALQTAVEDAETHRYDETGTGLPAYRRAVSVWYQRRFGVTLDPDTEVLRLIGSKEGLAHLIWALCGPGDVCLYPDPGYPVYSANTALAGAEGYPLALTPENEYQPDFGAIPADIRARARLLILCYPHMPTGAVVQPETLEQAVEFCRAHDIVLAFDLAYSELTYDGYRAPAPLQLPHARAVTVEFHSLSKTYRMTGWRIAWACGNREVVAALAKLKANLDSGQFLATQRAAVAALTGPQDSVEEACRVYQERRDLVVGTLNRLGWHLERPRGALYVWAPVPKGMTGATFCERVLRETAVVLTPGAAFGAQGEGYFRIAVTVVGGTARLAAAMERLSARMQVICGR